jgi:hypothetical protein
MNPYIVRTPREDPNFKLPHPEDNIVTKEHKGNDPFSKAEVRPGEHHKGPAGSKMAEHEIYDTATEQHDCPPV